MRMLPRELTSAGSRWLPSRLVPVSRSVIGYLLVRGLVAPFETMLIWCG